MAYQLGYLGLPLGQPIAGRRLPQALGGQHPGGRLRQQVIEFPLQRVLQRVQNMELLGVKVSLVPLPEQRHQRQRAVAVLDGSPSAQ